MRPPQNPMQANSHHMTANSKPPKQGGLSTKASRLGARWLWQYQKSALRAPYFDEAGTRLEIRLLKEEKKQGLGYAQAMGPKNIGMHRTLKKVQIGPSKIVSQEDEGWCCGLDNGHPMKTGMESQKAGKRSEQRPCIHIQN